MCWSRAFLTIWQELEDCGTMSDIVGFVPPKRQVKVLTPGACDCDLIWK